MAIKKIGIAGTRGIPAVYGGFETFAEELSIRLAKNNYKVTVYCDKGTYLQRDFHGVKLSFMPLRKSSNQVLYFFLSLYRGLKENDILIVTSTGASYFYWINFFFKKIIITNSDGIESLRAKWSFFTKLYLYHSQYFASKWSDIIVTDSKGIENYWVLNYPKSVRLMTIEYGAPIVNNIVSAEEKVKSLGLKSNDYYLVVARLEPENNIKMMVSGFLKSGSQKKMVIIGSISNEYYNKVLKKLQSERVIFLDAIYEKELLQAARLHAFAYLHGHSVGGTNPSLLEAMGCGNICICHDNIFNREVTNLKQLYFANDQELSVIINKIETLSSLQLQEYQGNARARVQNYYSWDRIAEDYVRLFQSYI